MTERLRHVLRVYEGSNGAATLALYDELAALGPAGEIARELFRAQKNSARAKTYRGGGYRGMAYDRKQWAMGNAAAILARHAAACGIRWGWGADPAQGRHDQVLYVDLPTGQVSFHTDARGEGPDYPGAWDGVPAASAGRIVTWCARLLAAQDAARAECRALVEMAKASGKMADPPLPSEIMERRR